jgi:hypothetical protein
MCPWRKWRGVEEMNNDPKDYFCAECGVKIKANQYVCEDCLEEYYEEEEG